MVRVRTECRHGFTALTVVLVTPFSILGIVYPPFSISSRTLVRNRRSSLISRPALPRRRSQVLLAQSKADRANPCEAARWNRVGVSRQVHRSRPCATLPYVYDLDRYRKVLRQCECCGGTFWQDSNPLRRVRNDSAFTIKGNRCCRRGKLSRCTGDHPPDSPQKLG